MTPRIAVLVLNYQGRALLEKNLPSVLRAADAEPGTRVYVVDNASSDGSPELVRERFPAAVLLPQPRNDFLFSHNRVAAECGSPLLVLLNNDLSVREDFLAPMLRHFSDPSVFAVGCKVFEEDGVLQMARIAGKFDYGLMDPIHCVQQLAEADNGAVPTLYPPGGAAMVDRAKFLALGGFDRIFWPIYWEDVDLGYRAARRGWRVIYEPASAVTHEPPGTTVRRWMSERRVRQIKFRNQLLFTWKNVSDARIVRDSVRTMLWHLRRCHRPAERWRARAILEALQRLPVALWRRRACATGRSDREVCPLVYES